MAAPLPNALLPARAASVGAALWRRRHDPELQLRAGLLAVFAAAAFAFGHVVEDYLTGDPIVRWDVELSRWIHLHSYAAATSAAQIVTWAGNALLLAVVTVLAALVLAREGRRRAAALLCVSAPGIGAVTAALKLLFQRPRPDLAYVHLDTYSFPSGHATGTAAIYGVVLYLLVRHRGRLARSAAACAFVVAVVAVDLTRLYLNVHYLSDVLAGTFLGVAWAAATLAVYEPPVRYRDSSSRRANSRKRARASSSGPSGSSSA